MTDIYMVLPSDSNLITRPNNKPNNFTVDLEKELNFDKYTTCSLHDIIFPEFFKVYKTHIKLVYVHTNITRFHDNPNDIYAHEFQKHGWRFDEHVLHEFDFECHI